MNVNSLQPQLQINDWLKNATSQLKEIGIDSARLDVEIILAHTLRKSRTYIHAHGDDIIGIRELEIANARLDLRRDRIPIAYIIGHKEFYGRRFKVTTATLIPRPESETMIDILKDISIQGTLLTTKQLRLIDVGTGSGVLGITAKLEVPEIHVTLTDISTYALNVAKTNARNLHANVSILRSNLLEDYPFAPDIILANLPYVDPEWSISPETSVEPRVALFAANGGLALIDKLIIQAEHQIGTHGWLLLEADLSQHGAIIAKAKNRGFLLHEVRDLIVCLQKR